VAHEITAKERELIDEVKRQYPAVRPPAHSGMLQ